MPKNRKMTYGDHQSEASRRAKAGPKTAKQPAKSPSDGTPEPPPSKPEP